MIPLASVLPTPERAMAGTDHKRRAAPLVAFVLVLCLSAVSNQSAGQDDARHEDLRYIIDTVVVTVREQANDSSQVIARVTSGERVWLTGQVDELYRQVLLDDGTSGWVDTRYLSDKQVARVEAEELRAELEELRLRYDESRESQSESEQSLIRLSDDFRIVNEELEKLRGSAGDPTKAERELEQLRERLSVIETEADQLLRLNKEFNESSDTRWFLIGAGVLLAGIVLGLALPKGGKKRSSWDRF